MSAEGIGSGNLERKPLDWRGHVRIVNKISSESASKLDELIHLVNEGGTEAADHYREIIERGGVRVPVRYLVNTYRNEFSSDMEVRKILEEIDEAGEYVLP